MKNVGITYHMQNGLETAESFIVLPMKDDIAEDILNLEERSLHMRLDVNGEVARLLRSLADIQGYEYIGAVGFELIQ